MLALGHAGPEGHFSAAVSPGMLYIVAVETLGRFPAGKTVL